MSYHDILARLSARLDDPATKAEQEAAEAERRAEQLAEWKLAQRWALESADVPDKDVELIGSGKVYETPAVQELGKAGNLVVLSGSPGCGKTTAAAVWIHAYIADKANWDLSWTPTLVGPKPMWMSAARLSRFPKYDEEAMRRLLRTPRLVLDDLGVEYMDDKGAYMSLLDEVLNERYAGRRPTVLTTNLTAEDFKARYGARIADRIREVGRFVSLGTKSYRKERSTRNGKAA